MLKNKKILTILLAIVMVLAIPTIVNAALDYEREFPSSNGTIVLNLKELTLNTEAQYSFALVLAGGTPSNWHTITSFTAETAVINLNAETQDIKTVLKSTDEAQLFIIETNKLDQSGNLKDEYKLDSEGNQKTVDQIKEEYVVYRETVNLKLPYDKAITYDRRDGGFYIFSKYSDISIDGYYFQKIVNSDIIEKWLEIKSNGNDSLNLVASLGNIEKPNVTFSTWSSSLPSYWGHIESEHVKNDGLYLLWIEMAGTKNIYGYIIHDGLPEATTVEEYLGTNKIGAKIKEIKARGGKIENTSSGWEYHVKTGDEVSVNIKFEEAIVLNESPRLTVKFGTGSNIELTTNTVSSDTLTYKYTVKNEDKGALQVLDLKGGNVTNNNGTPVDLTLVAMTGDPVVAIESTTETVAVTSVSLNKTKLTLQEGKTETLTATVSPSNAANKAVTYKSSDETVAKVDANGKVTAVKAGTATITVTTADGNKTATCAVTVEKISTKEPAEESTEAPTKLPNTGNTVFITIGIVALIVLSAIGVIKYKKFSKIV